MDLDDDPLFEPTLFNDSTHSIPSYDHNKIYTESEAIALLKNLPDPVEPFWRLPPILNADQIDKLYKLAETLISICADQKVSIWIDGGTLLGAIRHKGLIPWDDDLDFAIMKTDAKIFENCVITKLVSSGYGVLDWWYGGYRIFPVDGDDMISGNRYRSGSDHDINENRSHRSTIYHLPERPSTDTRSNQSTGDHVTTSARLRDQCKYPFADVFWMQTDKAGNLNYWNYRARYLWPSGLTLDNLRPLRNYEFGPVCLPGPNTYENHLIALYGPDWSHAVYQTRKDHKENGWQLMKIKVKLDNFYALMPSP